MEWRQRSESSSSSGHNSSSTCSGGLYRNMKGVDSVPTPVRDRGSLFQDFSPFKVKKERDFEERLFEQSAVRQKKSAFYLPCYVKPRRRLFETAEEVEVRQNSVSKREVWVRLLGFPSDALKDALAKYELVSLKSFERANPILVIYDDEERKRGLLVSSDKNSVTYLDVDTGEAKTASVQQVFEPDGTLLSIPNAAIRCRLEVPNCGSDSDFATENLIPHDWTRTKMRIIKWEAIPTISLSILDPHYDLKPVIVQRRIVPRTVQKLYRTLPGILVPPANTILRNCSVLSHEENNAYIMRNDAPFEIDPDETVSDSPTVPSLRELEQFYLVGDIVCAQYNDLEIRVAIESIERSSILLRSIDSGELYEVNDFRGLKSLSKREPCRTLKVVLPPEYTKIPDDHLEIFLKTGVFDVFFEDSRDPPKVRLFTVHGMEMNVCVGEKSDPAHMEKDSDDDTSSTRSSRG